MNFAARIVVSGLVMTACGPAVGIEDLTDGGTGSIGMPDDNGTDDTGPSVTTSTDATDTTSTVDTSTGPELLLCEPDAISCGDSEYGVWRLSTPENPVVAYLYMWPDGDLPRSFVSQWFVDDREQEYCTRNGTYALEGEWDNTLVFETEGLGGTIIELCGGAPGEHTIQLELHRRTDCQGDVFTLVATDSNGASLYAFEGHAVHCDCTTAYDPYSGSGEPLPTENCIVP